MSDDEISQIGILPCRKPAEFVSKLGFNPTKSSFTTEMPSYNGLTLVQPSESPNDTAGIKIWQHPSWQKFGYMGAVTTDDIGNAYCCPIPFVNNFNAPLATLNRVYKVDHNTGEMALFSELPRIDSITDVVPFGPLGIYFDCHGHKIYVSTVGGSTREKENGRIYMLNQQTGKIEDELKGVDAIGICVGGITGTKRLFFGKARTSEVFSIELSKDGHFKGQPTLEFSLDQLGPRGDDKVRRLRFDKQGNLLVHGVEFNFSLAAASVKPETAYLFTYYHEDRIWKLKQIQ